MERLKGKVALITGAASGLGRACAERFVYLAVRSPFVSPSTAACLVLGFWKLTFDLNFHIIFGRTLGNVRDASCTTKF